jgi:hypothetical protein
VGEGVELVPAAGVLVSHLVEFVVRDAAGDGLEFLGRVGPRRVRVGIVTFPSDVIDADVVAELDADGIGNEAGEESFPEDLTREFVAKNPDRSRGGACRKSDRGGR